MNFDNTGIKKIGKANEVQYGFVSDFCKYLMRNDIFCWLDHGSLLGAVRGRISWDKDIDISIMIDSVEKIKECFNNYFLEKGYSSGDVQNIFTYIKLHDDTNFFGGSSISIDHDNKIFCMFNTIIPKQQRQKIIIGPWIDCFIIREYNKDFIINTHLPMFFHPKELIFPLKQITDKLGNDFWIPKEERKILSLIYDDWYIPQKMSFSQCMQKRVDVLTNNIEYNEIWKKIKEKYPDYITRQKRIGVRL